MAPVTDVVDVQITTEVAKIARQGFGVALILSQTAAWADPEVVREYASPTELAVDFASSTAEYKAGNKLFGQNPRPTKVLVGRVAAARRATQRWAITPVAVSNYTYRMKVGGTAITFTSDGSATVTEVIAGLKIAIDALLLAVTTSDQTTYLRAVANVAGAWFQLSTDDPNLSIAQDHADPGIATDLDLIRVASKEWYALITTHNSKALVDAAASWAESNKILYTPQTQDTAVKATVISGTDDVGESLKAAAYDHTGAIWTKSNDDFADAAWLGRCLPFTPGDETWKFKTLTGVEVGVFNSTQRTNLRAKNVNFYEETGGVNMTEEGYAASGKFLDFVRYVDYLIAKISEGVFGTLVSVPKIAFNDKGFAQAAEAPIRAQLKADEGRGVLEPGWIVNIPKRADISDADRNVRLLDGVTFECVYSGATHKIKIRGVVSV